MINYKDIIVLLMQLKDEGFDVSEDLKETLKSKSVSLDTLKYINDNRPLDSYNFIEKIRKSYNNGKSKLYKNIMEEPEEITEVLTTLASLQLQILLFIKEVENQNMFLSHMRFNEIQSAFSKYYQDGDLIPAIQVLKVTKADFKIFEQFRKKDR